MSVEPQPAAACRLLNPDAPHFCAASALARVRHGFFGREGGVSTGIYASLNAGTGSNDDPAAVQENRRRILAAFSAANALIGVHQVHSPRAVFVDAPFEGERPHADALVTQTPGLVLSILTADCAPVLLADVEAGLIGAAHAGWKGALHGVLEDVVRVMREHGAAPSRMVAAIGPCIHQASYEVGPEFEAHFLTADAANARFFVAGEGDRRRFNLPGFCASRLAALGVRSEIVPRDTYPDETLFSHRRSVHRREGDYGRNCAAISL